MLRSSFLLINILLQFLILIPLHYINLLASQTTK
jgi:hypothetical protein